MGDPCGRSHPALPRLQTTSMPPPHLAWRTSRDVGHRPPMAKQRKTPQMAQGRRVWWKANIPALLVHAEPLPYRSSAVKTGIAPNCDNRGVLCLLVPKEDIQKASQKWVMGCEKTVGVAWPQGCMTRVQAETKQHIATKLAGDKKGNKRPIMFQPPLLLLLLSDFHSHYFIVLFVLQKER